MELDLNILKIFYYLLSSLITSTLGTLIGAGGSALLGPLLLLTETSLGAKHIIGTTLACVVVNSISGSYRYLKIGTVDIKSGGIFSLIGIPFSVLAALTLIVIDTSYFKVIFGITLILITIFMFVQSRKNGNQLQSDGFKKLNNYFFNERRSLKTKDGEKYNYSFSMGIAALYNIFLGFVATFFGIGGGIIRTPLLIYISGFPVKVATATSVFSLLFTSLTGTIIYWVNGYYSLDLFLPAAVGAIIGAQIGALLSKIISGMWILRILAIMLFIMGIALIIENI
tara:strand:+ start:1704 stop:2552 length:849 start_codon:yes stop_codon:yes gene_type:complete